MFSELPKLFDRNFAIAYFLPAGFFLTANVWLLEMSGYWPAIAARLTGITLLDTTLAVLIAWILGILLLVLNRDLYRFLEGYGKYNPLRIFQKCVRKTYQKKRKRLDELNQQFYEESFTKEHAKERMKLMVTLAQSYPHDEDLFLPTRFGNTLRAFEVYPKVMYGFDPIEGWARILAVLPKEYQVLVDDAKTQVDWWVNLGILSFCYLIEFWIMAFWKWRLTLPWTYMVLNLLVPFAIFLALNYIFSWRAASAVIIWGDFVKSAFDLFRFKLLEALGISIPKTRKEEREVWDRYSQAIIYRMPEVLPELKVTNTRKPKSADPTK